MDSTFNYPENRDRALVHMWWRPSVTEWRLRTSATQSDVNWIDYPKIRERLVGLVQNRYVDELWPVGEELPTTPQQVVPLRAPVSDINNSNNNNNNAGTPKVSWAGGRWSSDYCLSGFDNGNWYEKLKCELERGLGITRLGMASNEMPYSHWALLLESPPGAGKTHLIKRELEPWLATNRVYVRTVDCSDDRLVSSPLVQLLEVPSTAGKVLLVCMPSCLRIGLFRSLAFKGVR